MLDPLFSFVELIVEPILEPTKEDVSLFIAQLDAFLASPQTRARLPMATPRPLTEETYKEMWMLRYQQHMGQMTFLKLLDKYEEILGISSPGDSE
jgi:hypothetical protein